MNNGGNWGNGFAIGGANKKDLSPKMPYLPD